MYAWELPFSRSISDSRRYICTGLANEIPRMIGVSAEIYVSCGRVQYSCEGYVCNLENRSGKSTFLMSLMNELRITCGSLQLNGTIAYVSQESWVFNANVKQNIIFDKQYEKK
ncbi:unnamed protein product, partial [Oppiella nova]